MTKLNIDKLGITPIPWEINTRVSDWTCTESIGGISPGFSNADDVWLDVSEEDEKLISAAPELLMDHIEDCLAFEKTIKTNPYIMNKASQEIFNKRIKTIEKACFPKSWEEIKELL